MKKCHPVSVLGTILVALAKYQTRLSLTELISILDPLLEHYPEAASIPNKDGRFPLHLAIECGRSWYNGVKILQRAAPNVIRRKDPFTGLHPFQLALASKTCDLTTAYQLLSCNFFNAFFRRGGLKMCSILKDSNLSLHKQP